jgi:phage/plasmid primase-like uncharacterized protein
MIDKLFLICASALIVIPATFISIDIIYHRIQKTKNKRKAMQNQKEIAKQIDSLIAEAKGKFFTLKFIKQDGTVRVINGKDKYRRLIKGTGSPATAVLKAKGYKNAVNRNRETWVSFMPEKVLEFKCGAIHKTF